MPQTWRSRARILALQALCAFENSGDAFDRDLEAFLLDPVHCADLGWARSPEPRTISLARSLAHETWRYRRRADEMLTRYVPQWSVGRMQVVDRNILRLGLYELFECPGTSHRVVLNEAIELARMFGGAESPAFVNGILDGVRRASDAEAGIIPADEPEHGAVRPAAAPDGGAAEIPPRE